MRRDIVMADAFIDDRVVIDDVVVHDGAVTIESRGASRGDDMFDRTAIGEMRRRNEREMLVAQTEVKTEPDIAIPVSEAHSWPHVATGRQRRPAAIVARTAPRHPARAPGVIRSPHPAYPRSAVPAAIMERRPTPRIIGVPVPSATRIKPVTAVCVRAPPGMRHRDGRLPAPAVIRDVSPAPVR